MSLNAHPEGLSLDELVEHSGLKVDRSTLFRHMAQLIEQGRAERIGKARASRYRPLNVLTSAPDRSAQNPPPPGASTPATAQSAEPVAPSQPIAPPDEAQVSHPSGSAEPQSGPSRAIDYEAVVKKAVRTVVRDWKRCNHINLQIYLSLLVKPDVLDEIAEVVEKELASLTEDDLDRFGLTPTEYSRFVPPAAQQAVR